MYEQWTIQMADDICSKKKNDVMQQRKMHLGKDSTKMDGDRGKKFNTKKKQN